METTSSDPPLPPCEIRLHLCCREGDAAARVSSSTSEEKRTPVPRSAAVPVQPARRHGFSVGFRFDFKATRAWGNVNSSATASTVCKQE